MADLPPFRRPAAAGEAGPPGTRGVRHDMACALPPPGGGGKRGRDTKVSLPLLTPQPFLRTRLPSVARLNARGPQGRLVLQGHALDRSGAFRRTRRTLCTVWPRTDSAANHARQIQGLTASQNLPDARNRAPVPSVSLHISDVSAQRRVWGSQEGAREPYGALAPFCPRRGHGLPRRGHGLPLTDTAFSAILEIQSTAPPFRFLAAPERK